MHFLQRCRDDSSHITADNLVRPSHLLLPQQTGMPFAIVVCRWKWYCLSRFLPGSSGAQALLSWQGVKGWKRMESLGLCSAQQKIGALWLVRHQLTVPCACRFKWCGTCRQLPGSCATGSSAGSGDERLFKWLEGDRPVNSIVDEIIADCSSPVNPGAPMLLTGRPPYVRSRLACSVQHLCFTSAPCLQHCQKTSEDSGSEVVSIYSRLVRCT